MWAESGAAVDDVLVTTSVTGHIFVQAKRSTSMSDRLDSTLGEAFQQFVTLFHTASRTRHPGTNEKRALDPLRDRLVLATSSATGPLEDFARVLRRIRELGTATRPSDYTTNDRERTVLARAIVLIRRCWRKIDGSTPSWLETVPFLQLVWIWIVRLDTDDTDEQLAKYLLRDKILHRENQAETAWKTLKDKALGLAKQRAGVERPELQRTLTADGLPLRALRSYEADIERLVQQTRTNLRALMRFARIDYDGSDVTIRRDYESVLSREAEAASLVVIGDAGCGKSGLLAVYAQQAHSDGRHVLVLNAGELGAASLGQLRDELALEHELVEVLEQWHGGDAAFLVIDALDSVRDERTAATLRLLIERVQQLEGRWRVVATIRKFDLKNGKHWQQVIPGKGIRPHFDPAFDDVRHLNVGVLSTADIDSLKDSAPGLHAMIQDAPPSVAGLLRVPFNLMLANELRRAGGANDLKAITTQLGLLDKYWDRRTGGPLIERTSNEALLRDITNAMVAARRLRVSLHSVAPTSALETMLSRSVLVNHDTWLEYAHHILFDYAVERMLFRPNSEITITRIERDRDLPVTAGPSLKYWLEGTWERDTTRSTFWEVALHLALSGAPAIAKIVAGKVAAEKTEVPVDCDSFVSAIATEGGQRVFMFVADAITANLARATTKRPSIWFSILERLTQSATPFVFHRGVVLLHALLDAIEDVSNEEIVAAGRFARAALERAWSMPTRSGSFVVMAIRVVSRTFRSDIDASESLLRRALAPGHIEQHGHEELSWLARSVLEFVAAPSFLAELYEATFRATASAEERTTLSNSQILGLTSNRKQDLEGAHWELGQSFEKIARQDIRLATAIAIRVANQYVDLQSEATLNSSIVEFLIHGETARFHCERYIHHRSARDEEPEIMAELARQLSQLASDAGRGSEVVELIRDIARHNRTALLLKELAKATMHAAELFLALREMLFAPEVVSLFSKQFVASLQNYHTLLSSDDRARIEAAILALRDSGYRDLTAFRLLQALGVENLGTEGRTWFEQQEKKRQEKAAQRPPNDDGDHEADADDEATAYMLRKSGMSAEDLRAETNCEARRRTQELRSRLVGLADRPEEETLNAILKELRALEQYIGSEQVHPVQIGASWGAMAEAASALARRGLDSVTDVLLVASQRPEPTYSGEEQFAHSPSWGIGQSRMEAASGLVAIASRSNVPAVLTAIEALARDKASSIRIEIGRNLWKVAERHRELYWIWLDTLSQDANPSVVASLHLGHALSIDAQRALVIVLREYKRWRPYAYEHSSLVKMLFSLILWHSLRTGDAAAGALANEVADDAVNNADLVAHVVMHLRDVMTQPRKLVPTNSDMDALRRASIAYVSRVTSVVLAGFRELADKPAPTEAEREQLRQAGKLLIDITVQVYFGSLAYDEKHEGREKPDPQVRIRFFEEAKSLLRDLAAVGAAGSAHYLIRTLASFIDLVDPVEVFLLIAEAVRTGRNGGYQYETLAVKEIVEIVERYLADFRVIFMDSEECRTGLRDILDTFVEAGWPETHRLVYSLDSIFR